MVASLGHGDLLVVADAGLPIPQGPLRIDLAYAPGKPPFLDVVQVLLQELQVERAVLAQELRERSSDFHHRVEKALREISGAEVTYVSHERFKELVVKAKAVVRTGEFTPYANLILQAGVVF
ncbi:D-ribose pyranase [Thermus sp. LT1-2-5]|uniref:D-ribose pyranase n=1 Tax=Thermus sp. LT1-2-5 TaxID=3026935 RepID=UPI0033654ADE